MLAQLCSFTTSYQSKQEIPLLRKLKDTRGNLVSGAFLDEDVGFGILDLDFKLACALL